MSLVVIYPSFRNLRYSRSSEFEGGSWIIINIIPISWFIRHERELIQDGSIRLAFVPGDDNVADIFTKILGQQKFRQFRDADAHAYARTRTHDRTSMLRLPQTELRRLERA